MKSRFFSFADNQSAYLHIHHYVRVGKVTYVLYWVLENEEAHARVSKLGVEKFYKRWNRCLTTMPMICLSP